MNRLKQFTLRHFELFILLLILGSVFLVHVAIERRYAFLSFYYVPVLLAGYYLGKRHAVGAAILSIILVLLLVGKNPQGFVSGNDPLYLSLDILSWAAFLLLTSAVVGILFETKQRQYREIKTAYVGIIEILTKYLEATDRYTQGHSVRVANLAIGIAGAMGLPDREAENVRVAALLHDIGKAEISGDIIRRAAELTNAEQEILSAHTDKGAEIVRSVGTVLRDAVPLILNHHRHFNNLGDDHEHVVPMGARIIAVADAYDAIITDRSYRKGRPPWQALTEIEKNTPTQFDPDVVGALRTVMSNWQEEKVATA
ncbi:MAG: HD domain-containing phosphohydrolase [Planctomycetota bacterium]